jgi:hypothetical protein
VRPSPSGIEGARPELLLLLDCCRLPWTPDAPKRIEEALASEDLDWMALVEAALSDCVSPLLGRAVEEVRSDAVPPEIRTALEVHCKENAEHSRWLIEELFELLDRLGERGIAAVPFKGPTLSQVAYGDPCLRCAGDLDLLVPEEAIGEVCEVLLAAGLRRAGDREAGRALSAAEHLVYRRFQCEYQFVRDRDGLVVDPHWAIAPRSLAVPLDHGQLWQRLGSISLLGREVPRLALEDLLLVLCVHGAKHEWSQLRWICDVAELTHRHPELDLLETLERARAQGAERIVLIGLALAQSLLELGLPLQVAARLAADGRALDLSGRIARRLARGVHAVPSVSELSRFRYLMRERRRDRVE